MSLWLIGVIIFLALLALVEGGIILAMRGGGNHSSLAAAIFPRGWLPPPTGKGQPLAPDDRIVLLDSAQDIALIHEQINRLFSTLAGAPPVVGRPVDPNLPGVRPPDAFPAEHLMQLQNEIDRIFDGAFSDLDIFNLPRRLEQGWNLSGLSSAMRIVDQGSNLLVQLDLPAIDPAAIVITLQDRLLTVTVNQDKQAPADPGQVPSGNYARRERLETKLLLPGPVEAGAARASYRDGVLRIEIPKGAEQEPLARNIQIL
jgi:HSP20 family molecular chaperone IbpA